MNRKPSAITARACAKTFADGVTGLHPLDLEVAPGETMVLLGPSGCGKTTLLRLLSGLAAPDPGGAVLFDERDVTALPIEKRNVGMVFQSYALFPNMTVARNVGYGPKLRGLSRAARAEKTSQYLKLCRIEDLAERRIDQLSGGQRQRVALARALAAEPQALFLDEPLTALDAALRETLRDEISEVLRQLEVTAIYVTHDQEEAMALADRIVVMQTGRIRQIGAPRDIYERPADRFVAEFVGEHSARRAADGSLLYFRPEAIRLAAAGEGEAATVRAATYLGGAAKLRLDTAHGLVRLTDHADRRLAPGDQVGLVFDETRAIIFDGEAS